jgi:hypothetical protein
MIDVMLGLVPMSVSFRNDDDGVGGILGQRDFQTTRTSPMSNLRAWVERYVFPIL